MMTKKRLENYLPLRAEKKQLKGLLLEVETPIYSPDTQKLSDMPRALSLPGGGSKQEKIADSTWRLREWYNSKIAQLHAEQLAIELAVEALKDPDQRRVIRCRYLEGRSWSSVAGELNISRSTAFDLHKAAIRALRKIK